MHHHSKGDPFCFKRYNSDGDQQRLISHIIESTKSNDGSLLVSNQYDENMTNTMWVWSTVDKHIILIKIVSFFSYHIHLIINLRGMLTRVYIQCVRYC